MAESPAPASGLAVAGEVHLANIVQLTRGQGENAEAYWSNDGSKLIFQTMRPPYGCDQIMEMAADGSGAARLLSTGRGRTTCSYYLPGDKDFVYASTHLAGDSCPPPADMSQGYVWALYDSYDIFKASVDGGDPIPLTKEPGYDAEATVCARDGSIIFTSTRNGDIDLYRMDQDGNNVVQLTNTPGYDGGAFFSADCSKIVWRASRPTGEALAEYQRLLAQGLVRPSQLELFVANADGSDAKQVTFLGAASFAPFFHPDGRRILFSTNYPDPRGREFDIWSIDVDGTNLERVTYAPGFDGFPMFSPDGKRLAFASNRNQAVDGETDVYVADWVDGPRGVVTETSADRYRRDVAWLAADERGGRGVGTRGLEVSAAWLAERFAEAGAIGIGDEKGGYAQSLSVPVSVTRGKATQLAVDRKKVDDERFAPAAFSSSGKAAGLVVPVGYGIVAAELGINDLATARLGGKIALIKRFVPDTKAFKDTDAQRRYSDLHYKAFSAREKGAKGVIFYDAGDEKGGGDEAPLPELELARLKELGIPVVVVSREVGALLAKGRHTVAMDVELEIARTTVDNVVAKIEAGAADKLPGVVVIGAHYDHLGMGGESSLAPDLAAPHNGADDNASGTAALLEVARLLVAEKSALRRDVVLVAFTAEERGLLGSSHFVDNLPAGIKTTDIVAMLNMDMVGRYGVGLAVLGTATATEWPALVEGACAAAGLVCNGGGDGYGPSDQTPFYAASVPVLHFFTGAHNDYHKPSDDVEFINAAGGVRIAMLVAALATKVTGRTEALTLQRVAAPLPMGDRRSFGASLGTIPDYAAKEGVVGVTLSGVRPGSAADLAGIRGGDILIRIGKTEVRTVQDFVYVLRQAKPGQTVRIVVVRDGKEVTVEATYQKSQPSMGKKHDSGASKAGP